MQNNSQGHRNRLEAKDKDATHSELPGLRAQVHPVDEAVPAEVIKSFTSGVVTECLRLNVRETPDPNGEVVAVIDLLTEVVVDLENSTDGFYKISTATGIEGFCMKKYIALPR